MYLENLHFSYIVLYSIFLNKIINSGPTIMNLVKSHMTDLRTYSYIWSYSKVSGFNLLSCSTVIKVDFIIKIQLHNGYVQKASYSLSHNYHFSDL